MLSLIKRFALAAILVIAPLSAAAQPVIIRPPAKLGAVYVIGQSGVPFVMAGSGSMANNGALTLTNAIPSGITSAYVYLPANAISTGSTAGWYYALFTTTTAASVYNNTYTSGTPTVPASPTAFATTGPGAYTGASTAINAYALSIPGNTVGINGGIRLTYTGQTTNSSATKTVAALYGSLTLFTSSITTTAGFSQITGFKNAGQTGMQYGLTSPTSANLGSTSASIINGTIDTTAAQTLAVQLTNATPATNNIVLMDVTVEVLPGVP